MLFNSVQFALFFPLVTALYFLLPHRYRWAMLLAASCWFYMAFIPQYILILFFTIAVDYVAAILIERAEGRRRRWLLFASVAANLGVLAAFKYLAFFSGGARWVVTSLGFDYTTGIPAILLPIGLSFHTFQSLSYTIEVYRGNQRAERHPGILALYVMFYPQLVAGPIERPQNLLHQFRERHVFEYDRVTSGLRLMAWGLFMKAVIADNLAPAVNRIYDDPSAHAGLPLAAATVLFAFQIYCDFAGYSFIAIGSARVMGFRLMENFRQPYFSASISEFWRRWHISLSSWFRDYLYIPLGGNRVPWWRRYVNLLLVFAAAGLWHGPGWTFILWGLLHGAYLICSLWFAPLRAWMRAQVNPPPALLRTLQVSITFALVCFAWIFFRANRVSDALFISSHIWGGWQGLGVISLAAIAPGLAGIAVMCAVEAMQLRRPQWIAAARQSMPWRWAAYYALLVSIMVWGRFGEEAFIYFQF